MPEQPTTNPVQVNLQELAQRLRAADHLEPAAQRELADLVEELSRVLGPSPTQSPEASHLAQSTAHLTHALEQQHDTGLLFAAKKRLEESALRVESEAPLAANLVRRLMETLANLGI